ncbi:MAG: Gfo/Idh/MocA family oxidoreductase [Candidatus Margulisbacteria bacterium]|nr:Gfo/Idh/MocA family oxidoreductase [Candidatus Margulisiibacteriota bacterium]
MICVAVVGVGYWGPNLVRNLYKISGCVVKYCCDLDEKKLKNISLEYPTIKITTSYDEILNDSEIDAVVIATPVFSHFSLTKKALLAKKHCLIEKPMTYKLEEAEELLKIAKEKNLIIMVDHTFIYTGAVQKIKEMVKSGDLGKIYYFDSQRLNLGIIQPDVNVLWDLAPHDISIMNYVFNTNPISVTAVGSSHIQNKLEEMVHITVKYPNNLIGHIHVSWLSPVKIRQILIGGFKKMILFDDLSPSEKIKVYDKGIDINLSSETTLNPIYRSGDIYIPKIDQTEALLKECQHFIDCLNGKTQPIVSGEDGLNVVKILVSAEKSLRLNREIYL